MKWLLIIVLFITSNLAAAEDKINVGVILPLTGPLAEFGLAMQNGIKLAINQEPGYFTKLNFLYEDSKYDPKVAISAFRKLKDKDHIQFAINFGCPTSQALVPIVEKSEIPTAMFCSSVLMTKDKKYSFGMTPPASDWARILWTFLTKQNFEKTCLMLTDNDYLISEYQALQTQFKQTEIEIIDRFAPQDNDFKTSILKIKNKKCDALGVYLLPGQVRNFFKQSIAYDMQAMQIFGTDIFESKEEIEASRGGMENAVFVNLDLPEQFKTNYLSEFGNDNQATTACVTYDIILSVAKILSAQVESELIDVIRQVSIKNSLCGSADFKSNHNNEQFFNFKISLKKIKNNLISNFKD